MAELFIKSSPFLVLTIAALKPSSSPLGEPPLHVSRAATSALSPMASGHILHLKGTLHVDSSPQKELYYLSCSRPSFVLMYIFPGFP